MYKILAGIAGAGIIAGGGTLTADQLINPYTSATIDVNGAPTQVLEESASSTLPEAGTETAIMETTRPEIILQKFNGEVSTGITYQGLAPNTTGSRPFLTNKVQWSGNNQTMEVLPIAATSSAEDGGYEINIILNSKPASNVFNFSIDNVDQLDFFYQAPLWQEAGLKAPTSNCTDTDCTTSDGISHRPDNVVGSYAVYYKNHANHIEGQTNYATGKAYQIFRPQVTDASGNSVWGDLSYANGILTLTVPQSFLDGAVYPVTIDPTFGYTSIGASATGANGPNNGKLGSIVSTHVAATGDTLTSYNFYGSGDNASSTIGMTAYTVVSSQPSTLAFATTTLYNINNAINQWVFTTVSQSLTAGTNYSVAVSFVPYRPGTIVTVFFDSGSAPGNYRSSTSGLDDPFHLTGTDDGTHYSWYATYTVAATPVNHTQVFLNKARQYSNKSVEYVN